MIRYKQNQSLTSQVADLIAQQDADAAHRFNMRFPNQSANDCTSEIIDLNRYWRSELGKVAVNTTSERECLIDMIAPQDWFRHFQNQVLPTILRFQLPCAA